MTPTAHHKPTTVSGRSLDGGGMAFEREAGGTFTVGVEAPPGSSLLAAVAGCYGSVGRMVAAERGLDLGELRVTVGGEVDPRTSRGEAAESRAGYEPIR